MARRGPATRSLTPHPQHWHKLPHLTMVAKCSYRNSKSPSAISLQSPGPVMRAFLIKTTGLSWLGVLSLIHRADGSITLPPPPRVNTPPALIYYLSASPHFFRFTGPAPRKQALYFSFSPAGWKIHADRCNSKWGSGVEAAGVVYTSRLRGFDLRT